MRRQGRSADRLQLATAVRRKVHSGNSQTLQKPLQTWSTAEELTSELATAAFAVAQIRPNGLAVGSEPGLRRNAPVHCVVVWVVELQLVGVHHGIHIHAFCT